MILRVVWFVIALALWTLSAGIFVYGFALALATYWLVTGIADWRKGLTRDDDPKRLMKLAERYNQEANRAAGLPGRVGRYSNVRGRARATGRERVD